MRVEPRRCLGRGLCRRRRQPAQSPEHECAWWAWEAEEGCRPGAEGAWKRGSRWVREGRGPWLLLWRAGATAGFWAEENRIWLNILKAYVQPLAGNHLASHRQQFIREMRTAWIRAVAADMVNKKGYALDLCCGQSTGVLANWMLGARQRQECKLAPRCVRQTKVTVSKN